MIRTILIFLFLASCQNAPTHLPQPSIAISDLSQAPTIVDADKEYSKVFELLDGHWKGTFIVYIDQRGQLEGDAELIAGSQLEASSDFVPNLNLKVDQWYVSESPFFQRVKVRDEYPDGKIEESQGVNKVQDGKLYCIVEKPTDLVIHDGKLEDRKTIIWTRARQSPKAVEYFREKVEGDTYTITGYGYYGNDDLKKKPKMYFFAEYQRIK